MLYTIVTDAELYTGRLTVQESIPDVELLQSPSHARHNLTLHKPFCNGLETEGEAELALGMTSSYQRWPQDDV